MPESSAALSPGLLALDDDCPGGSDGDRLAMPDEEADLGAPTFIAAWRLDSGRRIAGEIALNKMDSLCAPVNLADRQPEPARGECGRRGPRLDR